MWILKRMNSAAILMALIMLPAFAAFAATSNDVDKQLRNAQQLYFKGDAREADDALKKAEDMAAEIMAGSDEAEKGKVKRLEGRLKKLRKDIDRKLGQSSDTAAAAKTVPAAKPAGTQERADELPSHVTSDLKVVERYIDGAQQNLNSGDVRNARRSLDNAQSKLEQTAERKKRYITPEHPAYKALLVRIEELDAAVRAAEKEQAEEKTAANKAVAEAKIESDKWVAKLKPYVTGLGQAGYDPDRYFVAGYTEDQQEMAKRTLIFGQVAADMKAYREAGLGDNATDELQSIVRDIEYSLKTFEESCKSMAEIKVKEAERQIDYIIAWQDKEAKKIGSKDMPLTMNRLTFESARRDLDGASRLLGEDEPRVKKLEDKYREAIALNGKIAKARVAQTRMIPDEFAGPELNALKKKAEEVLREADSNIQILRTTVITSDWKEESVIEWTDTTRSALQHRITRSVSAQAAGKSGGETILYTLHIAKDRRTDGSWSPLRGHIMFKDPILEENVGK